MLRETGLVAALILVGLGSLTSIDGQSQVGTAFDVASIKPNKQDPRQRLLKFGCSEEVFTSHAQPIFRAVPWAYHVEPFQVLGTPEWANSDPYDIDAKAQIPVSEDQCRLMVRALLADRFKLVVHRESREVPVFALVVAKNGPKMRRATNEENGPGFTINGVPMQMFDRKLTGWSMQQLTQALAIANLGRPILDRTGLEGIYRIALSFNQRNTDRDMGTEVTTALEEQLGLKLEGRKEAVEMLVIDHLEKPSDN